MTKLKLLGDRILLKQLPKPEKSPGGIVILAHLNDDRMQWKVCQVGTKVKVEVEVGDNVLCTQYHGNLHDFGDGRIITTSQDIIAKWHEDRTTTKG